MSNSLADSRMLSAPQERAAVDRSRDVLPRVRPVMRSSRPERAVSIRMGVPRCLARTCRATV